MQQELSKLGADIKCYDNEIVIKKAKLSPTAEILDGHNDHRIVMALSTVLTVIGGSVSGIEAVKKSFPKYFDKIKEFCKKHGVYIIELKNGEIYDIGSILFILYRKSPAKRGLFINLILFVLSLLF